MKDEYTAEDFKNAVRGRFYGKLIRDGKYWVRIHHSDWVELQQVEVDTGRVLVSRDITAEVAAEKSAKMAGALA
jgi:hypothetical protein